MVHLFPLWLAMRGRYNFTNLARWGELGFFGFKLHLLINNKGQIAQFLVTSANVADNNQAVLNHLFEGLKGCCFGDKGYLTKLFEHFYVQGFKIITKLRNNMKNQLMQVSEKLWLAKEL